MARSFGPTLSLAIMISVSGPAGANEISIPAGRTSVIAVEEPVGHPIEREPDFTAKIPSYLRAIESDRDQRWTEAAALYQQALIEVGTADRLGTAPFSEPTAFKIDLERRRSQMMAQASVDLRDTPPKADVIRAAPARSALSKLERARLLRLKLMSVRAATASIPAGLVTATLRALNLALRYAAPVSPNSGAATKTLPPGGDPEVRLLLCATRAAASDRTGARLELAHVSRTDRTDPTRALAAAACQAALGYNDDAVASLAVAVYRLGPASRFLPGQTRELQSGNDWDGLRRDPRFERLFR